MDQEDAVLPDAPAGEASQPSDSDTMAGSVKPGAADSDKENTNLDDMFDDDEDDVEFSSSAPTQSQPQPPAIHNFLSVSPPSIR